MTKTSTDPKRPRRHFDEQFRRDAVALCKSSDRPLNEIARQLGVTHWNLRDWLKADRKKHQCATPTTEQLQRVIARLQQENESLQAQRDILKKAMGILAKPNRNASL